MRRHYKVSVYKYKSSVLLAALVLIVFFGFNIETLDLQGKNIQPSSKESDVVLTELTELNQFVKVKPEACVRFDPPFHDGEDRPFL